MHKKGVRSCYKWNSLTHQITSLLARVRHTHAGDRDRGFPFWPMIETVTYLSGWVPTVPYPVFCRPFEF